MGNQYVEHAIQMIETEDAFFLEDIKKRICMVAYRMKNMELIDEMIGEMKVSDNPEEVLVIYENMTGKPEDSIQFLEELLVAIERMRVAQKREINQLSALVKEQIEIAKKEKYDKESKDQEMEDVEKEEAKDVRRDTGSSPNPARSL